MKACDDQEALKMEAYLKFYAEYLSCKSSQQNCARSGKKSAISSQRPPTNNRRKAK